ncbi:MAG: SUMF1/EgtB/PvdO family nonheme iron enzyme [Verrucomicrobiota bacterium]
MRFPFKKSGAALAFLVAGTIGPHTAQADTFGSGANLFTIDFMAVGDAGNPADNTGFGGVVYDYRISTYEINEDMINKANTLGGLGLTQDNRGANKPTTSMTWNEAARFVNWLNTSQGYQAAYNFAVQPGEGGYDPNANLVLWDAADAWTDGGQNLFRHKDAFYFLPSENEWYKAAYYSGTGNVYFDYATQQDIGDPPTPVASGTGADETVYGQTLATGPADITLAGGASHYGTVGQNGNAWEWNESAFTPPNDSPNEFRVFRGGAWTFGESVMRSTAPFTIRPMEQINTLGFRVGSVIPEPASASLLLGALGLLVVRRRRIQS